MPEFHPQISRMTQIKNLCNRRNLRIQGLTPLVNTMKQEVRDKNPETEANSDKSRAGEENKVILRFVSFVIFCRNPYPSAVYLMPWLF